MQIYFFRPEPRFRLVARFREEPPNLRSYLAIESRRWTRPEGKEKQWTYTGWHMEQSGSEPLRFVQRMCDVPEDLLCPIEQVRFILAPA